MMISQFNGTSTAKGSYSTKTGINYPMNLNRVHYKRMSCPNECKVQGKMTSHILKKSSIPLTYSRIVECVTESKIHVGEVIPPARSLWQRLEARSDEMLGNFNYKFCIKEWPHMMCIRFHTSECMINLVFNLFRVTSGLIAYRWGHQIISRNLNKWRWI